MLSTKTWSRYGRQIYLLKRIRSAGVVLFLVLFAAVSIAAVLRIKSGVTNERRELLRVWSEGDYEQAYEISKSALAEKPVDYFLLTVNGFSAYQVGISQINSQNILAFIDECIFSLRKALIHKESSSDGRVCYVLGKAYGHKGREYADLAVKYLEMANNLSYEAQDIPEYLGLAYAAYGDYRSSVQAFSQAFIPGRPPSDNLLLSIARSYMAMKEYSMAMGYLQRCVDISPDSKSIVISRLMLAEIYKLSDDYDNAEIQYLNILNDSGENAEVHYQLGELYNQKGDTTRARSEWRTAYRQDPAHVRARARLNI
jgi:tetratricopeptide (TPR) repeat protein